MRLKLLALSALPLLLLAQTADYKPGPDAQRQPNVPTGKVEKFTFDKSKIFPGTTHTYWVYTPAQYDAAKPAPYMVFLDGGGFVSETGGARATIVLDNLIARKDLPAMIGIFIDPGVLPAISPDTQMARYNRSHEYDALGDRNPRFLLDELIPVIAATRNLSKDPSDHAIGGSSSGGIGAFTAAWERPDAFRRVFSFVGSYADLQGGDYYPSLIRKMEAKPLRIFLQDGDHDQSIYGGSWWMANQSMASALQFAGYDYTFVTGTDGHSGRHGNAILPDVLRWLWRDYPAPVSTKAAPADPRKPSINTFIDVHKGWELVAQAPQFSDAPAVDKQGNIYFTDPKAKQVFKLDFSTNKLTTFLPDSGGISGLMFGPDDRLYAAQGGRKRVVSYALDGTEKVLAENVQPNDLAVSIKNEIYFTEPTTHRIWFIDANANKRVVFEGKKDGDDIALANGIRLSPDQSLLTVADSQSKWVWSFQVLPSGDLANAQRFYHLETLDDSSWVFPDGMTYDTEGFLYVATKMGIQVCDQPGRVNGIIAKPLPGNVTAVAFGGPNLDYLYVAQADKLFRRPTKRKGTNAWTLIKLPRPGL